MGKNNRYKFLLLCADKFPPFRVDVSVLFGKEFTQRGHEVHWLLQSDADCKGGYTTHWNGGKVVVGPTDNGKSTFHRMRRYILRSIHAFKIFSLVAENDYDFIQVKDRFLSALLALMVAKYKKIKFFYWLSFPYPESYFYTYKVKDSQYAKFHLIPGLISYLLLYKIIFPYADHIFAQSERMKQDIALKGIPKEKITPVPMGIEVENDGPICCNARSTSGSEKKILHLGSLAKIRELDFLLKVLRRVLAENIPCKLFMVGGSENSRDLEWLQQTSKKLGVEDHVVFTGNLPRHEAFEYVKEADICLSALPPIPIMDAASPTKLVEYLLCGKAAVVNDHPEQRLIIEESQGGICTPYDEAAFAQAVITLLKNNDLAAEMGKNGRKYVLENRSYKVIASRLEATYKKIMQK